MSISNGSSQAIIRKGYNNMKRFHTVNTMRMFGTIQVKWNGMKFEICKEWHAI